MNDKIVEKLLEHDARFDAVQNDIKESENRILERLDNVVGQLQRLDGERYATIARCDRIEETVERHDKDIVKLKKVLKTA